MTSSAMTVPSRTPSRSLLTSRRPLPAGRNRGLLPDDFIFVEDAIANPLHSVLGCQFYESRMKTARTPAARPTAENTVTILYSLHLQSSK